MPLDKVEHPWYALAVKPRHEKAVAKSLRSKGFPEFVPLYVAYRHAGGRTKTVQLPLFPTYVFTSFDLMNRLAILKIPGVFYIVSTGRNPAPVDASEIDSIASLIEVGACVGPWPYPAVGQMATIEAGPLRGLQGIVTAHKGKYRLVISVTAVQRSVCVEIDRAWVRTAEQENISGPEPRAAMRMSAGVS